jgi:toxin ParE1/3/4
VSYALELLPGALEDLGAAAEWYEHNTPKRGEKFIQEIEAVLIQIRERPEAAPPWGRLPRIRARVVPRLRYRIFYEIVENTIFVHAIAHTSRNPEYWLDRRS